MGRGVLLLSHGTTRIVGLICDKRPADSSV